MNSYGEPWRVEVREVLDSGGDSLFFNSRQGTDTEYIRNGQKAIERATTCVNACRGIRNPAAIADVIAEARAAAFGQHAPTCPIVTGFGTECICQVNKLLRALAALDKEKA